MIEAVEQLLDAGGGGRVRGAVDEDDRQAEGAGGGELGIGGGAAAILGDEDVDAVLRQERAFGGFGEGAAGEENLGPRQGVGVGRVDGAEQVMVLRGGAEARASWRPMARKTRAGVGPRACGAAARVGTRVQRSPGGAARAGGRG